MIADLAFVLLAVPVGMVAPVLVALLMGERL